jgi:hypothetical protein
MNTTELTLFAKGPVSKKEIMVLAADIATKLDKGELDPFIFRRNLNTIKKLEEMVADRLTATLRSQADKYPEKTFLLHGAKFTKTETGVQYDYTQCNDPVWNKLKANFDVAKEELDKRQKFLQAINGHETVVDEDTAEVVTIYPPAKKSTSAVTCSIE